MVRVSYRQKVLAAQRLKQVGAATLQVARRHFINETPGGIVPVEEPPTWTAN